MSVASAQPTAKPGKALRILGQCFIGAFFVWHALAIGIFAIPIGTQDPAMHLLRVGSMPIIGPYIMTFSQWQQWNLFSPDPLRRVSEYRIEYALPGSDWESLRTIQPGTYEVLRHAAYFKMHIGMFEKEQDTYHPKVVEYFLRRHCAEHELPRNTSLRLVYRFYVIDAADSLVAALRPNPWPPRFSEIPGDPIQCP